VRRNGTKQLIGIISAIWFSFIAIPALLFPHAMSAAGPVTGNAANGKVLFEKRCTGCHDLEKNKEGPRLRGVYGRQAGSVADFNYSDQVKALKVTWDDVSLDRWLTNPDAVAPDNDMAFHVSNPQERADIIQFLRLSSGK
jgi:cytochrome c